MQQPGFGLAERGLRITGGEEMTRGEEVCLDDVLHIPSSRGPGADPVEVGGWIVALGKVDAGEESVEHGEFPIPIVCARRFQALIAKGAGGGEVAEVEVMADVRWAPRNE